MIQILTNSTNMGTSKEIEVSRFSEPKAFDDFDINIIDLSFSELWRNQSYRLENTNLVLLNDLKVYNSIISNSKKSVIIVVFPQNINYQYNLDVKNRYTEKTEIKNILEKVKKLIRENIYDKNFELIFEITKTLINKKCLKADFYFSENDLNGDVVIKSTSDKVTTIMPKNNLYFTTLNILENEENLYEFLNKLKIKTKNETQLPDWIDEVNILNDEETKNEIKVIESTINENLIRKEEKKKILEKNLQIKSILYETDKNLQNQVSNMLCEIFNYSDSDFVDEMEEDFRIKLEDITFLIETKGLTKNLAGTDVSKLFNHVEVYLETADESENVKGLLIVATERLKKIEERNPIPDRQILIAKRNGLLIISTEVFLKIYEDFINKKISQEEIKKSFIEKSGNLNRV